MKNFFRPRFFAHSRTLAAAATLILLSSSSFAGPSVCPTCSLLPSNTSLVAPTAQSLGINVAAVMSASGWNSQPASPLNFSAPVAGPVKANWDGMGELPGSFQRPWELAPNTNFDPTFRTSYWTPETGPIETAWAPWNLRTTLDATLNAMSMGPQISPFGT